MNETTDPPAETVDATTATGDAAKAAPDPAAPDLADATWSPLATPPAPDLQPGDLGLQGPYTTGRDLKLDQTTKGLVASLVLPAALDQHREAFEVALRAPDLGAWPDGATYVDAKGHGPDRVLRAVLRHLHPFLPASLKVGVVWRDGLVIRGATAFAAISKASGRLAFFTGLDAILEVDWSLWNGLRAEQRLALIDHEAHHLTWDSEKDRLGLVGHDVEEFGGILRRWGLWRPNLVGFAADAKAQLELLPDYLIAASVAHAVTNGRLTFGDVDEPTPKAGKSSTGRAIPGVPGGAKLKLERGQPSAPTAKSSKGRPRMAGGKGLKRGKVPPEAFEPPEDLDAAAAHTDPEPTP